MSGRIGRMHLRARVDPVVASPFAASDLTQWYPLSVTPSRPGAYRLSLERFKDTGHAYSYWDGARWTPLGDWQDYSTFGDAAVWRGLARDPVQGFAVRPPEGAA